MEIAKLNFNSKAIIGNSIQSPHEYEQMGIKATFPRSSRASLRRFRAEAAIPSNHFDVARLPLNKENANQALEFYNKKLAELSKNSPLFEIELMGLLLKKLALHCYLEQTSEAVKCIGELNQIMASEDEEDGCQWFEGDLCHSLISVNNDFSSDKVLKNMDPLIGFLLLKAKGIALPEPDFLAPTYADNATYPQDYQKIIALIDDSLQKNKYRSPSDRSYALMMRGFCKAMLGDYDGALQDYPFDSRGLPSINWGDMYIIRGLTYYLKGDLESARKDFWPSYGEEMSIGDLQLDFLGMEKDLAGFFMKQILSL